MDRNIVFWSKILDGIRETDGFQPEYPRCKLKDSVFEEVSYVLPSDVNEAFRKFCKDRPQNMFIALSSGVAAILAKSCFSEKVFFGVPVLLSQKGLKNTFLLCTAELNADIEFQTLVRQCGTFYQEALQNQDVAQEVLADALELKSSDEKPLLRTMMMMQGLHDERIIKDQKPDIAFLFDVKSGKIMITIRFNTNLYSQTKIERIADYLLRFYACTAVHPKAKIGEIEVLSKQELQLLESFQGKNVPLADRENVLAAFRRSVKLYGKKTALVEQQKRVTYAELDQMSDRIAGFLEQCCGKPQYCGVYMKNGIQHITAILGIMKVGAAYVPIDYDLPYNRIKSITQDISLSVIITQQVHIPNLLKMQNECRSLKHFLCMDSDDLCVVEEETDNDLSNRKLWEFVGSRSTDDIEGGGWQNSYTGANLSELEMSEYGENVKKKIMPYVSLEKKVLEVGCASGITMFRIAPYVKHYYGTDLAQAILDKDQEIIKQKDISNITLCQKSAIDIDTLPEQDFDIIIVNSVIQCFNGYNYFRAVMEKLIRLASDHAVIFLGDVMDADKKDELLESLRLFAAESAGKGYKTKTDWSQELFFSKTFLSDLRADYPEIVEVSFSDKIGTIRNELTDYRYDAILRIDKTTAKVPVQKQLRQYGSSDLAHYTKPLNPFQPHETTPAYVIYTSGTTGKPKGIEILHGSLMRFCKWNNRYYELTEKDITTRYARVGFDAAVWELFPALCAGCEIHIIPEEIRLDLHALNSYFQNNGVTFSFLPTQMLEQFMEQENTSLRVIATGGDKLSRVRSTSYRIVNNYGPTEATILVTSIEVTKDMTSLPIGKPIDNVRIHILDRFGKPQPIGTIGEICIAGDQLAKGYVNLPALTDERFCLGMGCGENRIYHTGDLGRWLPDGNIEFYGRIDGQIKISAFRIEMEEISISLCEINGVSQAIVRAIEGTDANERSLCAYAITDNDSITQEEICRYLSCKLPDYMIPTHIILMQQFPMTPNGKIDYAKLPEPDIQNSNGDLVLPENETESTLLEAFCKTLATDRISVTDSFFECGGNSIKAIKLVADLTQHFDVKINDVFNYQSVREIANHIIANDRNLDKKFNHVKDALLTISETDSLIYNKEKYDRYLQNADKIREDLKFIPDRYKSVFYTGSTGFLGINLLRKLLCSTNAECYTVVRGTDNQDAMARLLHKWKHQFGSTMPEKFRNRLHCMVGDLTQPNFGLTEKEYKVIAEQTDCIINTAANVRHYGHYEEFLEINAKLVKKLADFAINGNHKDLHHVSTIGIAEGVIADMPFFLFTEDDSDAGQHLVNYYTETKLKAEQYVASARRNGIHCNIYRVGNLIANSETGVFQENIETNGFYKILRAMLLTGIIPDTSIRMLDFSFIDQTSDAMLRLIFSNEMTNQNYHLFNPNHISMSKFTQNLHELGMQPKLLSSEDFLDELYRLYNDEKLGNYIKEFILHTRLFSIPDETHFTLVCDRTCRRLAKLQFSWKPVDVEILTRIFHYCVQTGFITKEQEEWLYGE